MPRDFQQTFLKKEESVRRPHSSLPFLLFVPGSLEAGRERRECAWPALSLGTALATLRGSPILLGRVSLYEIIGFLRNGPRDHRRPPGAEICYH